MGRDALVAALAVAACACGAAPTKTVAELPAPPAPPAGPGGWEWVAKKGELIETRSTVFNADGSKLAVGTELGLVFIWDLYAPAGAPTVIEVGGAIRTLAFSPTGLLAIRTATINNANAMRVWDPATQTVSWARLSESVGASLFWGPNGEIPVVDDKVGTLLVDADNHTVQKARSYESPWAWSHDYQHEIVSVALIGGGAAVQAMRMDRSADPVTLNDGEITMAEVSADDKLVVMTDPAGVITVSDMATGKVVGTAKDDTHVQSLVWSPTGIIATTGGHTVRLWDKHANKLGSFDVGGTTADLMFRGDGKVLSIAREDGLIELWSVSPPKHLASLAMTKDQRELVFSPDGRCDGEYTQKDPIGWHEGNVTQRSAARWKSHRTPGFLKDALR